MRLSAEIINSAEQRPNPLGERELVLRGRGIPLMEHLGATRDAFDTMDFTDNRLTRLDNFPRLQRLAMLSLANNLIESFDTANLSKNLPNLTALTLSYNRISTLHQVANIGKACPKLEFLSLVGNPVTRRQHYRLYAIRSIPSLKVLDFTRISPSERDTAQRLAQSAAGAALESDVQQEKVSSKTFTPGEGQSAQESFQTSFTKEQKEQLRDMVANAKSPAEIEQIEASVQKGVFPSHLLPTKEAQENGGGAEVAGRSSRKRSADEAPTTTNGEEANHKKAKK